MSKAVELWEDAVGDSGEAPTSSELATYYKAVREQAAAEIRAVANDRERKRPMEKDAKYVTDLANDFEWAAMIAEGSNVDV